VSFEFFPGWLTATPVQKFPPVAFRTYVLLRSSAPRKKKQHPLSRSVPGNKQHSKRKENLHDVTKSCGWFEIRDCVVECVGCRHAGSSYQPLSISRGWGGEEKNAYREKGAISRNSSMFNVKISGDADGGMWQMPSFLSTFVLLSPPSSPPISF
jgi:hypothetical protein